MKTRRGNYPSLSDAGITRPNSHKRQRLNEVPCNESSSKSCLFDLLHDDLLINIAVAVSSTASSPADLINTMLICKRFYVAATYTQVLASASMQALAVKAQNWSDAAHRFLKQCADAGNTDASYTLGMIRFYCLNNKGGGASLMAKAAMSSHAAALHSLAVIQFNGSGATRKEKDLKAGVALCARAATLGHVDAMREFGHCLQDGYGVVKNVNDGRRLLLEANAREAAAAVVSSPHLMEAALKRAAAAAIAAAPTSAAASASGVCHGCSRGCHSCPHYRFFALSASTKVDMVQRVVMDQAGISGGGVAGGSVVNTSGAAIERYPVLRLLQGGSGGGSGGGCSLLSDFGCNVPPAKLHPANAFLVDWFTIHPPGAGLRLCSHANCGRPETRKHEFRRCSACGSVNYCSRACQALDWKLRHKSDCTPGDWEDRDEGDDEADDDEDDNVGGAAGGGGGEDDEEEES